MHYARNAAHSEPWRMKTDLQHKVQSETLLFPFQAISTGSGQRLRNSPARVTISLNPLIARN